MIKIGVMELREEIGCEGNYINLSREGEGMGLSEEETKELEDLLKEFLDKHF